MLRVWGGATPRTLRAHWMLHELGLAYDSRLIGSRTGETRSDDFLRLNPKGKIPVLEDDDFVLTESVAIVTYLGDRYGPGTGLIPTPLSRERARYDEWASHVQMELDAHTLYVIRRHRDLAALYGEAPAAVAAAIDGFQAQAAVAEAHLAQHDYLIGDRFTAADLLLHTCLEWANAYAVPLADVLDAYRRRIRERPAWQAAAKLNFSVSAGA